MFENDSVKMTPNDALNSLNDICATQTHFFINGMLKLCESSYNLLQRFFAKRGTAQL